MMSGASRFASRRKTDPPAEARMRRVGHHQSQFWLSTKPLVCLVADRGLERLVPSLAPPSGATLLRRFLAAVVSQRFTK